MLKVGSLFSGIGGIELGLERAGGFETVWFVENNLHAQAILRKHWPNTIIYDDITTVDFNNVPKVDVLTGGFPCQDISNAGKRVGISGSRSGLWRYCVEAVRVLRPRIAFFENVAALTRRGLQEVLCDLAKIGYDAEWHCVPAAAVGAPHRRDRIIILAHSNNNGQCKQGYEQTSRQDNIHQERQTKTFSEWREWQYEVSKSSTNAANSNDGRYIHTQVKEYTDKGREQTQCDIRKSSKDVEYTNDDGFFTTEEQRVFVEGSNNNKSWTIETIESQRSSFEYENVADGYCSGLERKGITRSVTDESSRNQGWWAVEPDVGRVAHGIPLRVDRIKRLGNAVVPQWAEAIGKTIKEVLK